MTLTLYLDFDGVLVTKFSNGSQFDPICVSVLRHFFTRCKDEFDEIHLCIISNWRFDKTAEQLQSLLHNVHLLEHVDKLTIPIDQPNREQQILTLQQSPYFVILDDATYNNPVLQRHHLQLRPEDGLRAIDDVKLLLALAKGR